MLVHWKSLLGFGLVFWVLLCLTDFLGGKSRGYSNKDNEDVNFANNFNLQEDISYKIKALKFGWKLAMWNSVAFILSLIFCKVANIMVWVLWKIFIYSRAKSRPNVIEMPNSPSISKIPVMVKCSPKGLRLSETNIQLKQDIKTDASCPNLFAPTRSPSNISQCRSEYLSKCRTLYKNDRIFSAGEKEGDALDRHLENQCTQLKAEIAKIQASSLKEYSVLSRKLEAVSKDKKEVSKLLTLAQKENRAAKQQIEELLQEKGILIKKLENASKEFKTNIKTKKQALAKLEEVTANVDSLKQQLEQVSRDKEIMENKLKVLEKEYEKLQERLILSNQQTFSGHEHRPERDLGGIKTVQVTDNRQNQTESRENTLLDESLQETGKEFVSVSQTELDMKKIQVKIKQLEKNLENLNNIPDTGFSNGEQDESEISLSMIGNISESQMKTEEDTDFSDFHISNSPRLRFWGGRAGEAINTLASKVNEKVRFLDNIRETVETELDEYSSQESLDDARGPTRIVSSSMAFQNFLKSLHPSDNVRRQFGSHCDLIF